MRGGTTAARGLGALGKRILYPAYLGFETQKRLPHTAAALGFFNDGAEGVREAEVKRQELLQADRDKFDGGYGLGEMAGRGLNAVLNPVSYVSANVTGLAELAGLGEGNYTNFATTDPMNVGARGEAGAEAVKSGKKRLLGRREVISDMFQGLENEGLEFAPEKFFNVNRSASRNAGRFLAGRPADAQFAESEKEQVMEAERLRAQRTQQEGGARSYEDVMEKKQRGTARKANMFFEQADREYLAKLAKNDPERLMTKFDTRGARTGFDDDGNPVYDSKPDGKLDPEERMSLFNPKTGIKQMRADDEAVAKKKSDEEAAAKKGRRAERRFMRDFDDEVFDDLMRSEKQREDNEKAQRKAERRYQRDFDDEVFSDLMYEGRQRDAGRRALARDLESQFAYSDSPSSAFQNPETREKLMVDAYKRGKELGLRDEQIRGFLRNRNLLDRGFSESYEDFYNRNTQGGGLSLGKLGARRQVGSKGGAVTTDAGRQQKAAANQALMQYIMQQRQPRFNAQQQPLFNPMNPNPQFGMVNPISGGLQNVMPRS